MTITEKFIEKAKLIPKHKNCTYEKTVVIHYHEKVIITCEKHGDFLIRPDAHLYQKQGCKLCGYEQRKILHKITTEQFIEECLKNPNNTRNDYSMTVYDGRLKQITFRCKRHGLVTQQAKQHEKNGCNFCSGRGPTKHTHQTYTDLANQTHNSLYTYPSEFNGMEEKIEINCQKHGIFSQRAGNHVHLANACPSCVAEQSSSKAEKQLLELVRNNYNKEIIENDRKVFNGKEIDVYLPELKLGFEYNGLYFHREEHSGRKKHWEKSNIANSVGIKLFQIYDIEWENKYEIVKSKILSNFTKPERKIGARQCVLSEISNNEKNEFLEKTHIQGKDNSKMIYALKFKDEIVACMTFGKPRYNKNYDWELMRYSTSLNVRIQGGASKLLAEFRKKHSGSIVSYADRRWSVGDLYYKLGFNLYETTEPSFCYYHVNRKTVHNRMKFQKQYLKNMFGYDEQLAEWQIMKLNGYDRVWDAGMLRFGLK